MPLCPRCGHSITDPASRFCPSCGSSLDPDTPSGGASWVDEFLGRLKTRLEEEHDPKHFQSLAEQFYASGFRDQLGLQLDRHLLPPGDGFWEDVLDLFIIHYAREVIGHALPEAILRYQGKKRSDIHLQQMVWDYLEPAAEQDDFYRELTQMPLPVLKNASAFFLTPGPQERIFLLCDQSMLRNGQEGFALTEWALYWKAYLHAARRVAYSDLDRIRREKTWLLINGQYFDGGPGLNAKMMRLLRKLARLYQLPA